MNITSQINNTQEKLRGVVSPELFSVINWFLENMNGYWLTPIKIQKLMYFSQSWSLAYTWEPLFQEDFQARSDWPVIENVYNILKDWYNKHDTLDICHASYELPTGAIDILCKTRDRYWHLSWHDLSDLTHTIWSPWEVVRRWHWIAPQQRSKIIIPKITIESFFTQRMEEEFDQERDIQVELLSK